MDDRISAIVHRRLAGESASAIAADLKISRARVYQLLQEARQSGEYSIHVQVKDARGVDTRDAAAALRRSLASYGLATHKDEEA